MQDLRLIIACLLILSITFIFSLLFILGYRRKKYDNKFADFALNTKDNSKSLLDNISELFWFIIKKISLIINKSKLLNLWSKKYDKYISYSDSVKIKAIDIMTIKLLCFFITFILFFIVSISNIIIINYYIVVIVAIIAYFFPNLILNIKYTSSKKAIENDILSAIIIMNNAFKNGANINKAIKLVTIELDGSISDEFKKIEMDLNYGLTVGNAFLRFSNRVMLKSTEFIAETLLIFDDIGGNVADVFSYIEQVLLDNKDLNNEFISVTSGARFIYRLSIFLPMLFLFIIIIWDSSYIDLLFSSKEGIIIFGISLCIYILYILIIRKAMRFDE